MAPIRRALACILALICFLMGSAYLFFPFVKSVELGSADWIGYLYLSIGAYGLVIAIMILRKPAVKKRRRKRKSRRKTRIVAIDDEEDILRLLRIKLSREGYRVITASDGNEGVTTVLDKNPDVMLVDIMMPGKDGFEVVTEIKRRMGKRSPVIIMLSSRSTEKDIMHGLSVGADDYVTKPFSPTELIERINIALLKQKAVRVSEKK